MDSTTMQADQTAHLHHITQQNEDQEAEEAMTDTDQDLHLDIEATTKLQEDEEDHMAEVGKTQEAKGITENVREVIGWASTIATLAATIPELEMLLEITSIHHQAMLREIAEVNPMKEEETMKVILQRAQKITTTNQKTTNTVIASFDQETVFLTSLIQNSEKSFLLECLSKMNISKKVLLPRMK